jgi:hypothetical protein
VDAPQRGLFRLIMRIKSRISGVRWGGPAATSHLPGPKQPKPFAMPRDHRLWLDEHQRRFPSGP